MRKLFKSVLTCVLIVFSTINYGQSLDKIRLLKDELMKAVNDSTRIKIYHKLAVEYWDSHPDSSYIFLKKRIELAAQTNNQYELAKGNESLGVWLISNGEYSTAIQFLNTSLKQFQELEDSESVAYLYSSLGYAHLSAYETNKAISYYLKSLKLFREQNDENGVSELYNEIGNLFYTQKNYDEAKCYFEDGLAIKEQIQDSIGIATIYTNLGNVVSEQKNYELGLSYYRKSIAISEALNDDYGLAVNYNNIGDSYVRLEEFEKSQEYFQKAQELVQNIHYPELRAVIYLSRAEAYLLDGKYYSAIRQAEKSLGISESIHNLEYQAENYKFLAESYSKLEDYEKANEQYRKYDAINIRLEAIEDRREISLFNTLNELEESYFTINNLSAENELVLSKYLTEKKISYALIVAIVIFSGLCIVLINQQSSKKQAYNLLEYKNFLIEKMNEENSNQKKDLEELNNTKDKFFSIIGHDLKNPFNSIQGFSELLIENFEDYDKEKQLKFLKIIKDSSVRATSLLNNLLLWANNQSGNIQFAPKKIQLINQVADVVTLLKIQAANKEIEIITNIDPEVNVLADDNMLNTILRNLISNAIKFTDKGGQVSIFARVDKDMATVFVKDTGMGISKEFKNRLFNIQDKSTSVGTNNEQGSGLGLILCQDFVQQNGGELLVESKLNEGSTFYFTVPLHKEKVQKKAVLRFKTA